MQNTVWRKLVCCSIALAAGLMFFERAELPAFSAEPISPDQEAFFERQIRPVLAEHCYECHGPDDQSGGLRLDSGAALLRGGDSGPAVTPKDPEQSRMIRGVRYNDLNFQMPPAGKLPAEAIAALEAWVKMGAPWPKEDAPEVASHGEKSSPSESIDAIRAEHWSYQPVKKPALPPVENEAWVNTPIDRFILAKLEAADLKPNPAANRRTLLRRLYFDLIGLPPTYAQVKQFVEDDSPGALAKVVDELLDNPHYGERWARHWLDIARYSDTMGYMGVATETRYPYAYTYRDWVIDAFNSDKPYNEFVMEQLAADQLELPPEDRSALAGMGFLNVGRRFNNRIHEVIDDRIDVVSRGFLGLSVSCARCHDHKFDPIPTADYYSLYGVFASCQEPDQLPLIGEIGDSPQAKEFQRGLADRQKKLNNWLEALRVKVEEELRNRASDYLVYEARVLPQYDTGNVKQQGKTGFLRPGAIKAWHEFLADRKAEQAGVWQLWHALAQLPKENFAAACGELLAGRLAEAASVSTGDQTATDLAQVKKLTPAAERLIAVLQKEPVPQSMAEVAERFGELLQQAHADWKEALKQDPHAERLADAASEELRQEIFREDSPLVLVLADMESHRTQGERGEQRKLEKEIQAFEFSHPAAPPRAMVLEDKEQMFDPVIFRRGLPGNRGPAVPRRFLQVLSQVDGGEPFSQGSGRLELARAIASEKNPLTPRVIVNRIWQHHFGTGLVRTPSDFGERGERPTHPELLDWLAATFMEQGWSIKQLHRVILLSAVWQQQSTHQATGFRVDPENRLLWKMNRRRLEFEPLRDAILLTAGKLDGTIGGKSVNIHQGATRRGLYAFVDREDIPGLLAAFDIPNPDATTAVRSETTVPQQALFLMNSPLMVEQARALAARTASQSEPAERVKQMIRLALARDADEAELALAVSFLAPPEMPVAKEQANPVWQFGSGFYDEASGKLVEFKPLAHFTGQQWQASAARPDATFQYLLLSAAGGHPGGNDRQAAVRRWISPVTGTVRIKGTLKHEATEGNGVEARIVSSRSGELGTWTAHHSEIKTAIEQLAVEAGDTVDFVVGPRGEHSYDSFAWSPKIEQIKIDALGESVVMVEKTWDSAAEFAAVSALAPRRPALDPWVQLAQVLLLSNEFVFVD